MPAFFDYIRNITYYLLFAALVGLVAPTGKYKKFVSLIMGFILLVLILQPISSFIGTQIPVTEWFQGILPEQTHHDVGIDDTYSIWRDTYLAAAFESQLEAQLDGLLTRNGITLHSASFEYTEDFSRITSVRIRVSREEEQERRVPFIRIEPIRIEREEPPDDPLINEVKNLISGFYNLPETHIHVEIAYEVNPR